MYINDATKVGLETKAILVDSECFSDLTYAIDREGKGMYLLLASGKEIAISDPVEFAKELFEIWQLHGRKRMEETA